MEALESLASWEAITVRVRVVVEFYHGSMAASFEVRDVKRQPGA